MVVDEPEQHEEIEVTPDMEEDLDAAWDAVAAEDADG